MPDPAVLTLAALEAEGVGAGRLLQLRDAFGTVAAGLEAAAKGADPPARFPRALFHQVPARLDLRGATRRVRSLRQAGIDVVAWDDPRYPAPLWLDDDAPPALLYLQGTLPPTLSRSAARVRAAAIVGTRRPTGRGVALAKELAASLAALDVAVVSGLALGIDGAAHEGALDGAGPTVAVLGGGHRHLHPPSHRPLARRIVRSGGAVLSEHPPEVRPDRHTFPERNRLISGLSRLVVVVEAGLRSGSNSTVEHANRQHRDVFACPGRPGDPAVAGTLRLIRDGALPVTELEDVLFHFRAEPGAPVPRPRRTGPAAHDRLLGALYAVEEATIDELATAVRSPVGEVLSGLTALEMRGSAVRTLGGRYRLAGFERDRRTAAAQAHAAERSRT
jgi:DNA processing protein